MRVKVFPVALCQLQRRGEKEEERVGKRVSRAVSCSFQEVTFERASYAARI